MSAESRRYGKRVPGETVHHIFPRDIFPEYQLADWNLVTITSAEHNQMHERNTGALTETGLELLKRTARKRGMDLDAVLDRMARSSGPLQSKDKQRDEGPSS